MAVMDLDNPDLPPGVLVSKVKDRPLAPKGRRGVTRTPTSLRLKEMRSRANTAPEPVGGTPKAEVEEAEEKHLATTTATTTTTSTTTATRPATTRTASKLVMPEKFSATQQVCLIPHLESYVRLKK